MCVNIVQLAITITVNGEQICIGFCFHHTRDSFASITGILGNRVNRSAYFNHRWRYIVTNRETARNTTIQSIREARHLCIPGIVSYPKQKWHGDTTEVIVLWWVRNLLAGIPVIRKGVFYCLSPFYWYVLAPFYTLRGWRYFLVIIEVATVLRFRDNLVTTTIHDVFHYYHIWVHIWMIAVGQIFTIWMVILGGGFWCWTLMWGLCGSFTAIRLDLSRVPLQSTHM